MSQAQITLDAESVNLLDSTAAATAFSREEALKEAIENYSVYDRWFRAKVEEGLEALQAGNIVSNEQVEQECSELLESICKSKAGQQ